MEGAASAIAVVSLALQLIQTADTIKTFIQDVKGAPAELQRVSQTLDALRATLDDVRSVLEYQNSRLGQQVPPPSTALAASLKRCEDYLEPLKKIVADYGPTLQTSTQRTKTWNKIKFNLKTKDDIIAFESRIRDEMSIMNVGLSTNNALIQLRMLPDLHTEVQVLKNTVIQQYPSRSYQARTQINSNTLGQSCSFDSIGHTHRQPSFGTSSKIEAKTGEVSLQSYSSGTKYFQRMMPLSPPSKITGLRKKKIIRFRKISRIDSEGHMYEEDDVICEETIYTWASSFLGYGAQWRSPGAFGRLAPALNIYPVEHLLFPKSYDLMQAGTLEDFNSAFKSGKLHPFMRDAEGDTLLHLAASFFRLDVCELLVALGLRSTTNDAGALPFQDTCWILRIPKDQYFSLRIDITLFFLRLSETNDFDDSKPLFWGEELSSGEAAWLLAKTTELFGEAPNPMGVRSTCVSRLAWGAICDPQILDLTRDVLLQAASSRDRHCHSFLKSPSLLSAVFAYSYEDPFIFQKVIPTRGVSTEDGSFVLGDVVTEVLSTLDVDMEEYKTEIFSTYPNGLGLLQDFPVPRRLIMAQTCRGWSMGWEWAFNPENPLFLLMSEFKWLTVESYHGNWTWPLYIDFWYSCDKREKRRQRRAEKRAQKELRRSAQIPFRNRMPGSWVE